MQLLQHVTGHVGQAEIAAVVSIREPLVVDAQQMQHRGVQIVNGRRIDRRRFNSGEAEKGRERKRWIFRSFTVC